jgi:hypothetical protein
MSSGSDIKLQVTPWSILILEKLIVGYTLLVKKFPYFYGTLTFIAVFTKARHRSLF